MQIELSWPLVCIRTFLYAVNVFLTRCQFPTDFQKKKKILTKLYENPSSGSRVVPCGRTDRHDEAKSLLAILWTRPKTARTFWQPNDISCPRNSPPPASGPCPTLGPIQCRLSSRLVASATLMPYCHLYLGLCSGSFLRSALFCDITQRIAVIPYRRFGTTFRSHSKGQELLDPCVISEVSKRR